MSAAPQDVEVSAPHLYILPDLEGSRNYAEKAKLARFGAEGGFVNGQYTLGILCKHGVGVEKDHSAAAKWLRLAAEQGHADAQSELDQLDGRWHARARF